MFRERRRATRILGIVIGCLWLGVACGMLGYRMWQIYNFADGYCYDWAWWLLFGEHASAAAGIGLMVVAPLVLVMLAWGCGGPGRCVMRRAFTLVEMLVVIAIIGVLVGLLLPAVQMARESSRRAACESNMRQQAQAITAYCGQHDGRFPLSPSGGWIVPFLPHIEQQALADELRSGVVPVDLQLPLLVCLSSPDEQPRQLDYGMNGGRFNSPSGHDWQANGLADRIDDIRDGASNTILVAENATLADWLVAAKEQEQSVLWFPDGPAGFGTNANVTTATDLSANERLARPASWHPGGVQVSLCDGSVRWLAEEIEYRIFAVLMTSYGERCCDLHP